MPLTSLQPGARLSTRVRWSGSITLTSLLLLAAAPVAAQSRVQAAPGQSTPPPTWPVPATTSAQAAPARAVGDTSPLDRRVTLELRDVPLDRALREIDRQAGLGLTYTQRVVPVERRVSVAVKHVSAGEALRRVLAGTGVTAEQTPAGTVILVRPAPPAATPATDTADTLKVGTIVGRVIDESGGKPLPGATVVITRVEGRAARQQAPTNANGVYLLRGVPTGEYQLSVRLVGYVQQERRVTVDSGAAVRADFALKMRQAQLDELVVTATGQRRRYELGHDVAVIDVQKVLEERPVANIADLLDGRVPGLTVQRTSGAPGDPSRIRIRGLGSVYGNNDPIVILDGIRIYAEQSDARNRNLANGTRGMTSQGHSAPSPIDHIDPNSLEKIEIIKGPSAATLYGADAANGVIVLTTKRGRPGPPRWSASMHRGISTLPGRFPDGMARWGHDPMNPDKPILCGPFVAACVVDSLVTFQALNDRDMTIIDRGEESGFTLGVSGGSQSYSYRLTGSYSDQVGVVRLPQYEATRFEQRTGGAPPDWMQRPEGMKRWSLSSTITTDIGERATASLTSTLNHGRKQGSSLSSQLSDMLVTYVDRASGKYYNATPGINTPREVSALIEEFQERSTDNATSFKLALGVNWRPREWLTTNLDAGVDLTDRDGQVLVPRGMADTARLLSSRRDTVGRVSVARGRTLQNTLNASATVRRNLPYRWSMDLSGGAQYSSRSITDVGMEGVDIPAGSSSITKAAQILKAWERGDDRSTFGYFADAAINHRRILFISTGIRMDGGSTYGSSVTMPIFPKMSVSYNISEESFFPFRDQIGTLRLRAAYGHSNVQPGASDRLRLYTDDRAWEGGALKPGAVIQTLGNTELRPERATELDFGFDADVLDDRLSIALSVYRQTRVDAQMQSPVAPSVYGNNVTVMRNVGVIRNTGQELTLSADLLRADAVSWNAGLSVGQNRNRVVELGRGVEPFSTGETGRVVAGYPLLGRWVIPLMGYSDRNGDGVITPSELLVGDSLVYVGASDPDYTANFHTSVSLFRRALTVSANVSYNHDLTQVGTWGSLGIFSPAYADPNSPLDAQAAIVGLIDPFRNPKSTYWNNQTVSTLRLESVAVQWSAPRAWAERAGARSLSVGLSGSNLGLHTGGYRGLDPHVNGYSTGNSVGDTGVIPQPRSWRFSVNAQY